MNSKRYINTLLLLIITCTKIVFSVATIALKLVNLSKTFKNGEFFNIKSGLLCFTFDVYCFITMLARKVRACSTPVGYIAMKRETSAKQI